MELVETEGKDADRRTAFVLGGGGLLGAAEVGMLRALLERGIVPDLIFGTSIGAINGALLATGPTLDTVARMEHLWSQMRQDGPFNTSLRSLFTSVVRSAGIHLYPTEELQVLLRDTLPPTFADLPTHFSCCAASIERSAEVWFADGELVPAVLASSALPGVFPPVEIDGEHYIDGGIVNSIPLDRARKQGATRAYVLQVGRIEKPLSVPQKPWQVAQIAFEVARRARFHAALRRTREFIDVFVLPTGGGAPEPTAWRNYDFRDTSKIGNRIEAAYTASLAYLDDCDAGLVDPRAPVVDDPTVA
ncbi:MAG: patatin-like phospholipase family protein [Actinobacteria bacterium]|nr:patatin-like phospholipase family protein [Actinomycetota bacterium]MCB9412755.1 patatin-like phospholipase family protein [Actinomycetota bacterium]